MILWSYLMIQWSIGPLIQWSHDLVIQLSVSMILLSYDPIMQLILSDDPMRVIQWFESMKLWSLMVQWSIDRMLQWSHDLMIQWSGSIILWSYDPIMQLIVSDDPMRMIQWSEPKGAITKWSYHPADWITLIVKSNDPTSQWTGSLWSCDPQYGSLWSNDCNSWRAGSLWPYDPMILIAGGLYRFDPMIQWS